MPYTVQTGDTLTGIALKLGLCEKGPSNSVMSWQPCVVAARAIADLNGISDPNAISVGQVLQLPTDAAAATVDTTTVPVIDLPAATVPAASRWLWWVIGGGALLLLLRSSAAPQRRRR